MSALTGLKVLDLSRVLAGPLCAQMLGDHGADVIKVEGPSGDETRSWGPPFTSHGSSAYFDALNRNKRNISLNLSTFDGRSVLSQLVNWADVLVENFKIGTMNRWGFDYVRDIAPKNPRLVYCRITGYGTEGALAGLPGYDAALQAYSGLMSVNGEPDGEPMRIGIPIVDMTTGTHAFAAILLALHERNKTDIGQIVEATLFDSALSLLHPHAGTWLQTGEDPKRTGAAHPTVAPYQTFPTSNGLIFVGAGNDRQFRALVSALGMSELADDERFLDNAARLTHLSALQSILGHALAVRGADELATELLASGVPASRVNGVGEALRSAHAQQRSMVVEADGYRGVGVPVRLSQAGAEGLRPPRAKGSDTRVIMTELGYSDTAIDELASRRVVEVEETVEDRRI